MKYFYVEPEVAGGLGENSLVDRSVHPPVVSALHYRFDGWPEDALLESFPIFIVSAVAKEDLAEMRASGVRFDQAEITTSDQFEELYAGRQLPKFVWLRIVGKAGQDDFGIAPDGRLVVSERALEALRGLGISNASVSPFI